MQFHESLPFGHNKLIKALNLINKDIRVTSK